MLTSTVPPTSGKKTGVTIGNFDGLHRGHKLLIANTTEICRQRNLDSVAITFSPHPRALFSGQAMPPLADAQTRREILSRLGMISLLELSFTRELAALTPEEFVCSYLLPLRLEHLVIGYDFCLGKGRSGDCAALTELGVRYGFSVTQVPPLMLEEKPISSTRIRRAIELGDLPLAAAMLGRPYFISGMVVHGRGRGSGLGFPTANLLPPETLLPPDGVYATRIRHAGSLYPAVTNIGFSPTFNGTQRTIESFILDADINLYGETIKLGFLERLRDERRFESSCQLSAQICRDVARARDINLAITGR